MIGQVKTCDSVRQVKTGGGGEMGGEQLGKSEEGERIIVETK